MASPEYHAGLVPSDSHSLSLMRGCASPDILQPHGPGSVAGRA